MRKVKKILDSEVAITINGYGLMGVFSVSLYGIYYLIRDLLAVFN